MDSSATDSSDVPAWQIRSVFWGIDENKKIGLYQLTSGFHYGGSRLPDEFFYEAMKIAFMRATPEVAVRFLTTKNISQHEVDLLRWLEEGAKKRIAQRYRKEHREFLARQEELDRAKKERLRARDAEQEKTQEQFREQRRLRAAEYRRIEYLRKIGFDDREYHLTIEPAHIEDQSAYYDYRIWGDNTQRHRNATGVSL